MPRLSHVAPAVRMVGWFDFVKQIYRAMEKDKVYTLAAAMAYSWLFSVVPLLIFLFTLLPYLPISHEAIAYMRDFLHRTLPREAARLLMDNIRAILTSRRGGLLTIGFAVALFVASGGMAMTLQALSHIYDVPDPRSYLRERALAIVLTLLTLGAILLVLIILPAGTFATEWLIHHDVLAPRMLWAWNIGRWVLAVLLLLTVIEMLYHFGPVIRQTFHLLTPGAVFCVAVWVALALAFREYIDRFADYDRTYGTLGGAAILLLLLYLDSIVLLIGAEINSLIDHLYQHQPAGETDFREPTEKKPPG